MASRRKRRAQRAEKKQASSGLWWKVVSGVGVLLIIGVIVGYNSVIRFLHSDGFRKQVGEKVSEQIGAPVELGNLEWSGLHMESPSISATSEGALELLEAKGIQLDVDTDYFKREVWEISGVQVQTANVELDLRKEFTEIEIPEKKKSWLEKMLPEKAVLIDAGVARADAKIITAGGEYSVKGAEIELAHSGDGYEAKLTRARVKLPFPLLDKAKLEFAKLRLLNQRLVIDEADFDVFESGNLELDGEVDLSGSGEGYHLSGVLTGLRCADLINEDWKQKLSGDVEAELNIRPRGGSEPEIKGSLQINDGQLTMLPVLDTIAAYTQVRDFKTLRFSKFSCDFYRYKQTIKLTNIYVHCDGLMRIEGAITFNGEKIEDGVFQVGLNPGTLSHIPGAEEKVFLPGKEGMKWTTVKVWGTFDEVEEDLTARMKAAALERLFDVVGGKQVLRFTNQAVENAGNLPEVLDKNNMDEVIIESSDVIIDTGADLIDSVTGGALTDPLKSGSDLIQSGLGGLLGGNDTTPAEDEKPAESSEEKEE